jgi:hypothetical protein
MVEPMRAPAHFRRWVLQHKPTGPIVLGDTPESTFRLETVARPTLGPGQALVQFLLIACVTDDLTARSGRG